MKGRIITKQRRRIRILCTALLATLALPLAACSTDNTPNTILTDPVTVSTTAPDSTTQAETEITRENYPDTLPSDLRFDGETFTMLIREGAEDEFFSEGLTAEIVNDATFKREQSVEDRLGIQIEWLPVANGSLNDYVRRTINANNQEFDLISGNAETVTVLGAAGLCSNWLDAPYVDFTQPWWNSSVNMVDTLSINDKLFFITGDLSRLFVQKAFCCYFNKSLAETYELENLYNTVLEGKWTVDRMTELSQRVYEDLDGNQVMDAQDRYGLASYYASPFDAWVIALGQSIVQKDEAGVPQFTLTSEAMVDVADRLIALMSAETTYNSKDKPTSIRFFSENHILFTLGGLEWATGMREMTEDFGIIPYPKLNEKQESYYTAWSKYGASLFAVPSNTSRLDFTCAVTEALAAESYRTVTTAYFETALKLKYAKDNESAQMLDMIRENMVFDFGFFYSSDLSYPDQLMRSVVSKGSNTYASTSAAMLKVYSKLLGKLLSNYE